jgi:putative tributyrin esterase
VNVATVRFFSPALARRTTYSVILPVIGDGPFPVLMQLHGYSDDHAAWLHSSNLVRHAAPYPMIIVLPDGGTSGYLNLPVSVNPDSRMGIQRYEDLMVDDLRQQIERTFRVRPGPWAIGGLSMGGFGAMRLGLKYPDRFASIWAHSGSYRPRDELVGLYPDPDEANIYAWADLAIQSSLPPVISFDCGVDDELLTYNRELHRHLETIGLPHTYEETEGRHDWEFWDRRVPLALEQHAQVFGIQAQAG